MFEAFDPERDLKLETLLDRGYEDLARKATSLASNPDADCRLILETGFRTRVMSYHSAHALGARSGLSLASLKERVPVCAAMIRAGLTCAIDEPLFAALVHHYAPHAQRIATACKSRPAKRR